MADNQSICTFKDNFNCMRYMSHEGIESKGIFNSNIFRYSKWKKKQTMLCFMQPKSLPEMPTSNNTVTKTSFKAVD